MYLGEEGMALIKSFEKCRLKAYQDSGGVWTIGWGHTGPEVHEGLVWTQEQADEEFAKDTAWAVGTVNDHVHVSLSQDQFDALVSFVFNCGWSAFKNSTLLRKLNDGYYDLAGAELLKWVKDDGVIVKGLVRRRAAELSLYQGKEWRLI
jgi:lysozyme